MEGKVLKRWMKKMEQRMARAESWFADKPGDKGNDEDVKKVPENKSEITEHLPGQYADDEIDNIPVRVKTHNLALYISHNEKNIHMASVKKEIIRGKIEVADLVIKMLYKTETV